MKSEIKDKVTQIFRTVFKDDTIEVTDTLTAQDVERWDSLSHMVLISEVEKQFAVKFKFRELVAMKNAGDLLTAIASKLGA